MMLIYLQKEFLASSAFVMLPFMVFVYVETNLEIMRNYNREKLALTRISKGETRMNVSRSILATCGAIAFLVVMGLVACAPAPTALPAPTATSIPIPLTAPTIASSTGTNTSDMIKLAQIQGFGLFLTDSAGRTLYAFDKDSKDTSNCTGNCLQTWPPFIVHGTPQAGDRINASLISTFMRDDGTTQAEYDGHPLYYYASDKNPGDIKGHGVGNVWHVLSPRGSPMLNAAPAATATPY